MVKPPTSTLFTIGFTKKSAEQFFRMLEESGVKRIIDIRLNPHGQLSGFSKQDDLVYFLDRLNGCKYVHMPALAPTDEIRTRYQTDKNWDHYVTSFETLMDERDVPAMLDRSMFTGEPCCLLCSEATPEKCHRRLVGERLTRAWPDLALVHLV